MGQQSPKGLLTSLVLFIVIGLFSLATLFTLLILEVRNGQQTLTQQLTQFSGSEHSAPVTTTAPWETLQEQITQLTEQQQQLLNPPIPPQLQELSSDMELLIALHQQSSQQKPTAITVKLPSLLQQQLEQISTTVTQLQQQQQKQGQQLRAIALQSDAQLESSYTTQPLIEQLAARPLPKRSTPRIDSTQLEPVTEQLSLLAQQQKRLYGQQKQFTQLLQQPTAPIEMPPALNQALQAIQQQMSQQQQQLSTIQQQLASHQPQPSSPPTPVSQETIPATPLTEQLEQIERKLMKSIEQSNTIKPYSYRAR